MGTMGIIFVLFCYVGPLVPPIIGTIVGPLSDAVTSRRRRQQRATVVSKQEHMSRGDAAGALPT